LPGLRAVANLDARGELPLRLEVSSIDSGAGGAVELLVEADEAFTKGHVSVRTSKIHGDGNEDSRTFHMFADYPGDPGNNEGTRFSDPEMEALVIAARERGYSAHVHACGDRMIDQAINSFESARLAGFADARLTICHLHMLRDVDIARMIELDIVANTRASGS
jgi:predicted amidohydrolase YtcJ